MKIKIKRFDTTLPLPEYKTQGAAAMDLCARETVTIEPQTVGYVPLNIALEVPQDYWVLLSARSSLHKKGLVPANGIGVGDSDYCGDDDEYRAALFNFTQKKVVVERGERVTQIIILPREKIEFTEVKKMSAKNRGGFGTTGK
jgi:dUTP pyrophosphatase